jgi:hypothetical protein
MASPGKKHFALRIDPRLWIEIERLAAHELRSANAEVEVLLREALSRRGRRLPPPGADAADPAASARPATPTPIHIPTDTPSPTNEDPA